MSVPAFAVGPGLTDTTTVDELEHPLEGSVTVTVYVPGKFTVGVAVVPPLETPGPDQEYVTPIVVELALTLAVPLPQLIIAAEPAVTFGGTLLFVTPTVDVIVHPFTGLVTVTVYVPVAFTVGDDVVAPDIIPGPVQLNAALGVV